MCVCVCVCAVREKRRASTSKVASLGNGACVKFIYGSTLSRKYSTEFEFRPSVAAARRDLRGHRSTPICRRELTRGITRRRTTLPAVACRPSKRGTRHAPGTFRGPIKARIIEKERCTHSDSWPLPGGRRAAGSSTAPSSPEVSRQLSQRGRRSP